MSDAADRLAQALRDLINEAVQQAVQQAVAHASAPGGTPHVRGQAPGDPVDEEIRREYEKRFGEPAPKVWVSGGYQRRRGQGVVGRHQPHHVLCAGQQGELSLVKIGRRSFVHAEELDDFLRRKRYDPSGRTSAPED